MCQRTRTPATGGAGTATVTEPEPSFRTPATKLSGSLSLLLWEPLAEPRQVVRHVRDRGKEVGVDVRVDHIDVGNVPHRSPRAAGAAGHDLLQYSNAVAVRAGVLDLYRRHRGVRTSGTASSWRSVASPANPNTEFCAYAPRVPDPGNFRRSLWEPVGFPQGPDLGRIAQASEIKKGKNVQLGLGMSQEIDSNMAAHALLWSFGASIQDKNERVVLNSPRPSPLSSSCSGCTRLDDAGGLLLEYGEQQPGPGRGQAEYILNSISAWRTSQEVDPQIAEDVFFTGPAGPEGRPCGQHVLYNTYIPTHATNPDAAKEFLLHYTDNWAPATYHSKLYDFPSWSKARPRPRSVARERPVRGEARRQVGVPWGVEQAVERSARASAIPDPRARPSVRSSGPTSSPTCSPAPRGGR